jgi:hypothetical protein
LQLHVTHDATLQTEVLLYSWDIKEPACRVPRC